MWRLLVTPRWLALTVLLLVLVAAFGWLGSWQWTRAHPAAAPEVRQGLGQAVPVSAVYAPRQPVPADQVGTWVRLTGRYVLGSQLLVPRTNAAGVRGYWVLTPLATADGAVMPVVRGWIESGDGTGTTPPRGEVTVVGELSPSDDDSLRPSNDEVLPPGQVAIVSTAELLNIWHGTLYQGYVLLQRQQPPSPLETARLPDLSQIGSISWQNLVYAIQWWLFALFAVFFWWRMLQADREDQRQAAQSEDTRSLSEAKS